MATFTGATSSCDVSFGPTEAFGYALLCRVIPRQKLIDPALFMAVDDGGERGGQVDQRIDGIELAGFDERGDGRPILCSSVMPCEECVLPIEGNAPFILPMSAMKSRSIIAGIRISARGFPFAASRNERQVGF